MAQPIWTPGDMTPDINEGDQSHPSHFNSQYQLVKDASRFGDVRPDNPSVYDDEFDGSVSPPANWAWILEPNATDESHAQQFGRQEMTVALDGLSEINFGQLASGAHWLERSIAPPTSGMYRVVTRVDSILSGSNGWMFGLWCDDKAPGAGTPSNNLFVLTFRWNGSPFAEWGRLDAAGNYQGFDNYTLRSAFAYLRMTVDLSAQTIAAEVSLDGLTWLDLNQITAALSIAAWSDSRPKRFGIYGFAGSATAAVVHVGVAFPFFRVFV